MGGGRTRGGRCALFGVVRDAEDEAALEERDAREDPVGPYVEFDPQQLAAHGQQRRHRLLRDLHHQHEGDAEAEPLAHLCHGGATADAVRGVVVVMAANGGAERTSNDKKKTANERSEKMVSGRRTKFR